MAHNMPTTTLGRTGLVVTRLGIGGAYCETPDGYRAALDCGVTYVDTARAYRDGKDEEVIGQALQGRRDGLVLSSKSLARDAAGARADLETSLRLLRTDYLDVWHIHYINEPDDLDRALAPGGAMETATQAREEGLIRFVGVTGHRWPLVQQAVKTGLFDTVLCWYNCAMREAETTVFPAATAHNTGVVIMNASRNDKLFGGEGAPGEADFYRYVLSHPAVNLTIMGLRDVDRFRRIAAGLSARHTLEAGERSAIEAYGARLREAGTLEIKP